MTMENPSFEDVFPIENDKFSNVMLGFREDISKNATDLGKCEAVRSMPWTDKLRTHATMSRFSAVKKKGSVPKKVDVTT